MCKHKVFFFFLPLDWVSLTITFTFTNKKKHNFYLPLVNQSPCVETKMESEHNELVDAHNEIEEEIQKCKIKKLYG